MTKERRNKIAEGKTNFIRKTTLREAHLFDGSLLRD